MRKAASLIAATLIAMSMNVGHAAELATCHGSVSVSGIPTYPTFAGQCFKTFTTSSGGSLTLSLAPGAGFTGTLRGHVTSANGTLGDSLTVEGWYVAGQLIAGPGLGTGTGVQTFPAGSWKLSVETKSLVCNPTGQGLGCTGLPSLAVGDFGGTVSPSGSSEPAAE